MRSSTLHRAIAASLLLFSFAATAQEKGNWRASSSAARSITGDIMLSDEKIYIDLTGFTMSRVRALETAELRAAFDADPTGSDAGSLYRLVIPAQRRFQHKNTLCGADDVQWMATYASGRNLQLVFFSGEKMPTLSFEALQNSTSVCGSFSYVR
jgi:hypothetical protein